MNNEYVKIIEDIQQNRSAYLNQEKKFDEQAVFKAINNLSVLNQPVQSYLTISEDEYIDGDSDHKLTLQHYNNPLEDSTDRLMIDHVDGFPEEPKINFEYTHKKPYENGKYDPSVDLQILEYSFQVISGVSIMHKQILFTEFMSHDALVSLAISAHKLAIYSTKK